MTVTVTIHEETDSDCLAQVSSHHSIQIDPGRIFDDFHEMIDPGQKGGAGQGKAQEDQPDGVRPVK